MTLEENIRIVLSLIDEYAPNSTNLFTEDEDIQNKIKILYNQPYQELSQVKKIKKIKNIAKTYSDKEYYREYSLPFDMFSSLKFFLNHEFILFLAPELFTNLSQSLLGPFD